MADPLLEFEQEARRLIESVIPPGSPVAPIETPPSGLGDRGYPCFGLAKTLRKAPALIAEDLAKLLAPRVSATRWVARVSAAGGYVNFFARRDAIARVVLAEAIAGRERYGALPARPERVILEHTSANPNGPLHVGRARNPIIGDTMARIVRRAGYKVETQYYLDDMGKQVALLAWGRAHLKAADLPTAENSKVDHDLVRYYQAANERAEKDPAVAAQVQALMLASEHADPTTLKMFEEAYRPVLDGMLESLKRIGVEFDSFQKESEFVLNGETAKVTKALSTQPISHAETNGALYLDLSGHGIQGRSQRFVYKRGDGTSLYATRDVAYHFWKATRADKLINILGEDHKLQAQQVRICLELLACKVLPDVIFYAFVSLPEGKMSTRRNRVVFLDDLVDEAVERAYDEVKKRRAGELEEARMRKIAEWVGVGALRYNIVRVQPEKGIVFKWEEALNFEGASAPFLQYAHTRCASILRKAGAVPKFSDSAAALLSHESELNLLYEIGRLPRAVSDAADREAPHLIAGYAQELAGALSAFYRDCPVLSADSAAVRDARLLLVEAARVALHNTLDLLGIPAPDEM